MPTMATTAKATTAPTTRTVLADTPTTSAPVALSPVSLCHVRVRRGQRSDTFDDPREESLDVGADRDVEIWRPAPHPAPVGDRLARGELALELHLDRH